METVMIRHSYCASLLKAASVLYCIIFLSEREQRMIIIVPMFDQAQENGNTDRYIQFHLTPKMWLLITIVAATHNLNGDFVHQYWEDQSS